MSTEILCILEGGPIQRIIAGGDWLFEWHPYCGPVVLNKDWSEKKQQPPERSLFWDAVVWWKEQGMRTRDGYAVWHYPEKQQEKLKHLGGKHYEIIGYETVPARPGWPANEILPVIAADTHRQAAKAGGTK